MKPYYKPAITLACLLTCTAGWAAEEEKPLAPGDTDFGAVLTTTFQSANKAFTNSELLYSIDLELTHQFDGWGVFGWVEHAKTSDGDDAASNFDNANADAGTAIDFFDNGRTQLSELYVFGNVDSNGEHGWQFGLSEVTTLIDTSELANDEVSQFLSGGLINNLTIDFPDYALAGRVQDLTAFDEFGYRLVVASSHGIQDGYSNQQGTNTTRAIQSYSELLDVDATGKGVFGALELVFKGKAYEANVGYWQNSAQDDYGLYMGMDYFTNSGSFNFRYGQADANEGNAEQFAAAVYKTELAGGEMAYGYTFTRFEQAPALRQLEAYYRKGVTDKIFLTPSVQYVNGDIGGRTRDSYWLFGLRMEVWL